MRNTVKKNSEQSLFVLTTVNSLVGIVTGLLGPFYILYIKDFSGSIDRLGTAYAIMIFTQAVSAYGIGKSSDKYGRKPFMIASAYASIIFLSTVIKFILATLRSAGMPRGYQCGRRNNEACAPRRSHRDGEQRARDREVQCDSWYFFGSRDCSGWLSCKDLRNQGHILFSLGWRCIFHNTAFHGQ
jgi:hypothetical protein